MYIVEDKYIYKITKTEKSEIKELIGYVNQLICKLSIDKNIVTINETDFATIQCNFYNINVDENNNLLFFPAIDVDFANVEFIINNNNKVKITVENNIAIMEFNPNIIDEYRITILNIPCYQNVKVVCTNA